MTGADRADTLQAEEKAVGVPVSGKIELDTLQTKDNAVSSNIPKGYTDQSRVLPKKELALVFLGLCLVLFMASLDQTIVSVLIPTLGRVFNAPQYIAWVGTSYLLTNTAMQPLYGKLSDIFGRKNTILTAIFFFELGSLICGAAPTIVVLVIGRGIAGLGAGGMISLTMIIISDVVSLRERGKYQGIIGSMFGISAVVGPLLGGVLAEKSDWRWAFYLNLPIGVVGTIALVFILKLPTVNGTRREKLKRIDFMGSFTIVVGIICVLISTNWGGNEYAWSSVQIIVPYCVGALFLSAFLYIEAKVAVEPILPFRLFRNRSVCSAYATSFFIGGAFMGAIFYCPLYFQLVMHDSATKAGLQLLPLVAGMLVAGIGSGVLISKTGRYRPYIWAALVIYIAGVALLSLWDEKSGLNVQIGFLFVVGLGLGGCMQSIVLAGQCAVQNADIATVTSMMSFFRSMGGVTNVAIGGSMINNVLNQQGVNPNNFIDVYSHPEKYAMATQAVFRQCIAWPALALIASLFLQHNELRKTLGAQDAQANNPEAVPEEK
ncbi:major facilitator superfamily domain-containing protein [Gamsiella multidivaricata]|uniref:major facilitator superfamily domain-containing protein n=1 Tax=Gamsiella multidivaricata TaxID=101098 RepID=UPI00221EF86E|nr:major facilitator superfamily domain-containing protein [Gamsiella multidivaricata]KAI7816949.1 major facilitator superfamily domain-containing protein [Gamsiella multidivaricata]